ncbi:MULTISPECIES: dihydroorotase [Thauera]|jgi:dihydroorotase|uniref:Dihydroorotase, multifunctional complex type n=1 Tax=Thauera aminoaromatica TaxID=164330 RepID=C4KCA1_THASP|nr:MULTISPECIES: dihydroorotase [Thauera]MDA0235041.1 dihydroorotase [Pseudomonadota bacterium]ACR02292.1 dihydroorotase, multifunctional complex type [Thauera aminoaromatica]KIN89216.1 dihydroorotase [Thauera sp. SWB20]HNV92004.1 dihydroorotase [Thauera aminoaromatica]HPV62120.1 dihydroorotase [Thauera aminoaromatica]
MNILISNGRVVDPANRTDAVQNVYVAGGKIVALGQAPDGFVAERTIDAGGLVVAPGFIDLAARLREPGYEYRATLESEMEAAMAGGVTSLAIPPDTDPVLDEPGLVEMLTYRAKKLNRAHIYPVGALTIGLQGERLSEMAELVEAGCVAFSQANVPLVDNTVLMRALQYAATFGFRVWLQPLAPFLSQVGHAHDGEVATRLGLSGIPVAAETVALYTYLELARITGARLHITRLSSAAGLALIDQARAEGMDVTCDVSINHVHLCDMDIGYFNPNCHLVPPLRSQRDREALARGLAEGRIDALCSDHTPVDDDAKQTPFSESEPGATGLELLLPLTLKWADRAGLALLDGLARITSDAAKIVGITKAGHLSVGARADVCVFDPATHVTITREGLRSQGKNTPFLGMELPGKVRYTLVEGQVMFEG